MLVIVGDCGGSVFEYQKKKKTNTTAFLAAQDEEEEGEGEGEDGQDTAKKATAGGAKKGASKVRPRLLVELCVPPLFLFVFLFPSHPFPPPSAFLRAPVQLVETEERATGSVKWAVVMAYARAFGGGVTFLLVILGYLARQGVTMFSDVWLAEVMTSLMTG